MGYQFSQLCPYLCECCVRRDQYRVRLSLSLLEFLVDLGYPKGGAELGGEPQVSQEIKNGEGIGLGVVIALVTAKLGKFVAERS